MIDREVTAISLFNLHHTLHFVDFITANHTISSAIRFTRSHGVVCYESIKSNHFMILALSLTLTLTLTACQNSVKENRKFSYHIFAPQKWKGKAKEETAWKSLIDIAVKIERGTFIIIKCDDKSRSCCVAMVREFWFYFFVQWLPLPSSISALLPLRVCQYLPFFSFTWCSPDDVKASTQFPVKTRQAW